MKLCIILQSTYVSSADSDSNSNFKEYIKWNDEVNQDTDTVKATLNDHCIIVIPISASDKSKQKMITDSIKEVFSHISSEEFDSCHVVLNTHGAAGKSDLSDAAVKEVVLSASSKKIKVTQISALLCNGMMAVSSKKQDGASVIGLALTLSRGRESSMSILHQKLQVLSTLIPQQFPIVGFNHAYDPVKDRDRVVQVLKGTGEASLHVTTSNPPTIESHLQGIEASIKAIESSSHTAAAENTLGLALDLMRKNIYAFLNEGDVLLPENKPLYRALETYANQLDLNVKTNFQMVYDRWKKAYKVKSTERMDMFKDYCMMLKNPTASASPNEQHVSLDKDDRVTKPFDSLESVYETGVPFSP